MKVQVLNEKFSMKLRFHFDEYDKRQWFILDRYQRRVPVKIAGQEGLKVINMVIDERRKFIVGDVVEVECELISNMKEEWIKVGVKGKLWESGFIADCEIL